MILSSLIASAVQGVAETEHIQLEGLIQDLAFILILGAVTTVLFKWLKQPVVLGYIVAGFLASPNFEYLPSITTEANIEFWAQLGIIVLLFSLGLEFSFKKLMNAGGSAVVTALIIMTGMMGTGFVVGRLLGFTNINSLFLGGMMSMSSTTIIIKALNDLNMQHRKFASLVFAVLIVEDLFAVVMMVVLSSIAVNESVEGGEMILSIAKLAFFLIIWFVVGVYVLPSIFNRSRRFLNDETILIVSMGLCLGMSVFSVACGFSLALGAFVMGSILAGTSFAEHIERVVTPVKDLFGSVFFISVGMMVNPAIIVEYSGPILILSALVIVGMIVFGTFGMLVTGQTLKVALESGFSLTQIGEFAFIIATLGMSLGVLEPTIYPIVVAVSVLTTFTTPYFIKLADPTYNFLLKHLPPRLHFLIDRYSKTASSECESVSVWRTILKRYLWRIVLYSAILIAICIISRSWLLPALVDWKPRFGRILCALITLAMMSPFLFSMLMRASKKAEREMLRKTYGKVDTPLMIMRIFRTIIVLAFIIYILSVIFSPAVGFVMGIIVFMLIVGVFSDRVKRRMSRVETKFLDNLNERELRRSGRNKNLVSNLHLAFMRVGYGCPFVGEQIFKSRIRSKYGVSVVSIQRGSKLMTVPDGETRIFPGDILGIIGTDNDIQTLLPVVEAPESEDTTRSSLRQEDLKLTNITLSDYSVLLGHNIANSGLTQEYGSMLVSLERDDEFLQPTPDLGFKKGDILWLVGDPKVIASLR